jgi:hypothetical protein
MAGSPNKIQVRRTSFLTNGGPDQGCATSVWYEQGYLIKVH